MSYAQQTKDFPAFSDYEVLPVMGLDENNNPVKPEDENGQALQMVPCDTAEDLDYVLCWSVYGRMPGYGVDCLADYKTLEEAESAERVLNELLNLKQ